MSEIRPLYDPTDGPGTCPPEPKPIDPTWQPVATAPQSTPVEVMVRGLGHRGPYELAWLNPRLSRHWLALTDNKILHVTHWRHLR